MKNYIEIEKIRRILEKNNVENIDSKLESINLYVEKLLKQEIKSKNRELKIHEEFNNAKFISEVYNDVENLKLPSWIQKELPNVKVLGNNNQTIMTFNGKKYNLKNSLNDLSGAEWTYFINSVINTAYKTSGEDSFAHNIRKIHPTPKPPSLMKEIIEFFTKENEIVLDYFMGVGGTLLGAHASNRRAIGIDLNEEYITTYQKASDYLHFPVFPTICGDSKKILKSNELDKYFLEEKASLILIDPPYGNMMSKNKTGSDIEKYGNIATPFTDSKDDLGNMNIDDFFCSLKEIVESSLKYLKKRGHIVVFIKDFQPKGKKINLLHAQLITTLNDIKELEYKGLKIWADQTTKLFPYGYPFSFVSNQIHQYIIIFRKEE